MKKLRSFFSKNLCSNLVPVFFAITLIAFAERRINTVEADTNVITEKTGKAARHDARGIAGSKNGKETATTYDISTPVSGSSVEESVTGKIEIPASKLAAVLIYATHLFNIAR